MIHFVIPRRLKFAVKHYALDAKEVLDVGCGSGDYLQHFGPGSLGIDINPALAQERGLEAVRWNFVDPLPPDLYGRFDVVWASNILEHVLCPHEFLIRVRRALRPNGLLLVAVPATRPLVKGAWKGFLAADHINFFTGQTLRYTMARAGYEIRFIGSPSLQVPRKLATLLTPVSPVLLAAASPIANFQYPEKAHKILVGDTVVWKEP